MSLGLLTSSIRVFKNLKETQYDRVLGLVSARLVDKDGDFSHILQRKSRLQLILLSCAVCGIEFCYAAETAFVSPTLLKIGVPVIYMTLIWCLSPFFGFFMVPILGSLSDKCKSPMGRRRPFILILSIGIILGLLLVPNGKDIGILLGDVYPPISEYYNLPTNSSEGTNSSDAFNTSSSPMADLESGYTVTPHPWSILFTVLGVVLLDFNCDACQSPCRAYLLDVTIPADHPAGLSTFTVMAGLGGSLGYVMGGINWHSTKLGESLGGHVRAVFSMVLVIYLVCLALTIVSVKEVPLSKLGVNQEDLQSKKKKVRGAKYRKFENESDSDENCQEFNKAHLNMDKTSYGSREQSSVLDSTNMPENTGTHTTSNGPIDNASKNIEFYQKTDGQFHENGIECPSMQDESSLPMPSEVELKTYLASIFRMPKSLAILCVTNLFCWMSLVCYSLYFTDFVGQAVYGGDPVSPPDSEKHMLYDQGVRAGSFGMSLYSLSCSVYSMCLESLVRRFKARPVYIVSQLVYTVGAALMAITRNKVTVILFSPCAGVMYATLFTMPYLLVAHYHSQETFDKDEEGQGRKQGLHIRGLGTDIALVSSMVFVAQFLLSACVGSIVHATGTTAAVMVAASILSFLGACAATQVLYLDL